jgi:hypothetical protein
VAVGISAMGHKQASPPVSDGREIGVTFNHELPMGRAEVLLIVVPLA